MAHNVLYLGKSGVSQVCGQRVAFCGGSWNPSIWRDSFENPSGEASEDEWDPHITNRSIQHILSDPSFKAIRPPVQAQDSSPATSQRQPQTLAEARRQAAAHVDLAEASSRALEEERARPIVDLLLTNVWPLGITSLSRTALPHPSADAWGCPPLAQLARRGKPRYFFSLAPGSEADAPPVPGLDGEEGDALRRNGAWWAREPYENKSLFSRDQWQYPTRFLSLATFSNPEKKKWFMAIALQPAVASPSAEITRPADVSANPFETGSASGTKGGAKRSRSAAADGPAPAADGLEGDPTSNYRFAKRGRTAAPGTRPPEEYRCKICGSAEHYIKDCPERHRPPKGYTCRICGSGEHFIRDCPDGGGGPSTTTSGAPDAHAGAARRPHLPPEGYVCKVCSSSEHYIRDCPVRADERQARRAALTAVAPQDCWFCLSNPKSANHLIAHIAEDTYLALPKGQLPRADAGQEVEVEEAATGEEGEAREGGGRDKTRARAGGVPGGGHVLIIPIAHVPSLYAPGADRGLRAEVERYRAAVKRMYGAYGAVAFCWELGRTSHTRAGHTQTQMVPVDRAQARGLAQAFRAAAAEHQWAFLEGARARRFLQQDPDEAEAEAEAEGEGGDKKDQKEDGQGAVPDEMTKDVDSPTAGPDYVRIDIGDEVFAMEARGPRFPLAFPRTFLAEFLGVPERADWKACAHSEGIERAETEEFKEAFQEWAGELDG